jgi:hypothetical protein
MESYCSSDFDQVFFLINSLVKMTFRMMQCMLLCNYYHFYIKRAKKGGISIQISDTSNNYALCQRLPFCNIKACPKVTNFTTASQWWQVVSDNGIT